MKKLKFLPSVLMLAMCIAALCVGVFSLTPTENTIGGTINISSMARVKLTCYVDEELVYDSQNTAYGVDWNLTESGAFNFDVSEYTSADEVPLRTIRIHIQNLTDLHLGAYFYNGDSSTLETLADGTQIATYDSLQLTDAIYPTGDTVMDDTTKVADVTLSPYAYIAPRSDESTYDELDMFINIDLTKIDIEEITSSIEYLLRIEEYQSNLDVSTTSEASVDEIDIMTSSTSASGLKLIKLAVSDSVTAVPTLADTTYGCIVIPTSYTSIPDSAFAFCNNLNAIAVPQGIATIGAYAFEAGKLDNLVIYEGVTAIGTSAFAKSAIKRLVLPDSLVDIGLSAFSECENLTDIVIGCGVTIMGNYAFSNNYNLKSVTIKEGVKIIGHDAFWQSSSLKKITVPNSVESLGGQSFGECCNLQYIGLGEGLTNIGNEAFTCCENLQNITIPNSVAIVGDSVFNNCSNMTITIENCLSTFTKNILSGASNVHLIIEGGEIGESAFDMCYELSCLAIGGGVKNIPDGAFRVCENMESANIEYGITRIGDGAFEACISLRSITIPDSVITIGSFVFADCFSLSEVVFPNSVTEIGESLFFSSSDITNVIFGDGITSIPDYVFEASGAGQGSVTFGRGVTEISANAFVDGGMGYTTIIIKSDGKNDISFEESLPEPYIPSGFTSFKGWALNGDTVNLISYGTRLQKSATTDNIYTAVFA